MEATLASRHRGDHFVRARHRRSCQIFAEGCPAVNLLWAIGIPSLRFLALPHGDRQELVGRSIQKEVTGDQSVPFESAYVSGPFRDSGIDRLWPYGRGHYTREHGQLHTPADVAHS